MSSHSHIVEEETIEFVHNSWWHCQRGEYAECSVLAGQSFRQLCESFKTREEAIAAFPDAVVYDEGQVFIPPEVPINPPPDFDPADAGEVWSGEEY